MAGRSALEVVLDDAAVARRGEDGLVILFARREIAGPPLLTAGVTNAGHARQKFVGVLLGKAGGREPALKETSCPRSTRTSRPLARET